MKYELTEPQKNIWNTLKLCPDSPITYIAGQAIFENVAYDYDMIKETLNNVIKTNQAYRTEILSDPNGVFQTFKEHIDSDFVVHDLSDCNEEEKQNIFNELAKKKLPQNSLIDFQIIKHSENKFGAYWKLSHLVGDGFTAGLFAHQLIDDITNYLKNEPLNREDKPLYTNLLDREKKYLESEKYIKDKNYFKNEYLEEPKYNSLALKQLNDVKAKRFYKKIESSRIKRFCQENNISEAVFFETLIMIYLRICSFEDKVVVGSPVLNRTGSSERKTTGMFVSTNPLFVNIEKDLDFFQAAEKVKSSKTVMFKKQTYPFSDLQKDIEQELGYKGKLFDIVISYQNAKIKVENSNLNVSSEWYFTDAINNEIIFSIDDRDETGFRLNIDYKTSLFKEYEIENISNRIEHIATQILQNPSLKVSQINPLIKEDVEKYKILNSSSNIKNSKRMIEIFEELALKNPDTLVLEYLGENFTYKQLNDMANSFADHFLNNFLDNDEVIPVVGSRSFYTIACILALRKINKPYFIIDDSLYSKERIDYLLDKVKAKNYLSYGSSYNSSIKPLDVSKIEFKEFQSNVRNGDLTDELFCLIHTSGSTGEPKFVKVPDNGVVNMACNNSHLISNSDCVVNLVHMSFDAFLLNTMLPILNSKKLILTSNQELNSIMAVTRIINNQNKCAIIQTPTRMEQFLANIDDDSWFNVRDIILGAEKISMELIDNINKKCNNPDIYNTYGLTETTVFNTIEKIKGYEAPIGKPNNNCSAYIVNKNNVVLPQNVIGEIVLIGDSIALGYFNNEEETNKKFFTTKDSKRGFRTGDYGYLNEDGKLVFIGRRDQQIKINGLRIDIEEIENIINNIDGIDASAVKIEVNGNQKFLVAFYESKKEIDNQQIMTRLESKLPYYMVPQVVLKIDSIPRTPSMKILRNKLPKFDLSNFILSNYIEPKSDLEIKIAKIWKEVLNVSQVGTETKFFSLGGSSKSLIDVLARIEKITAKSLNPSFFKENPSIKDMCDVLENRANFNHINIDDYDFKNIAINDSNNKKSVLLTGANGYLGSHFIGTLLNDENCDIYCLVRDKNKFDEAMKYYYGPNFDLHNNRIHVIIGDIGENNFGLSLDDYEVVKNNIGKIINCAANVSHFSSVEASKKVNIDGVYNLAKLAGEIGASFEHISTLTVSGINVSNQKIDGLVFSENELDIGQDYTHDAYLLTKYKAEEIVRKFYSLGLPCSVYRTGYISNRSYDNKFQINEDTSAFQMIIDTIKQIKIIPMSAYDVKVQSAPVDKISEAIVELSNISDRISTYHVYDPEVTNMVDHLDANGIEYEVLPDDEFMKIADKILLNSDSKEHSVVYSYLKSFITNITTNTISNNQTMKKLEELKFSYR